MDDQQPDWNAVIRTLDQMFPRELQIAMQAVTIEQLQTQLADATAAADMPDDPDGD